MSNEHPTPEDSDGSGVTILWLLLAFLPSLIGLAMLKGWGSLGLSLLIGAVCSLTSAIGMSRGVEPEEKRTTLMIFLAIGFFVLNGIIVAFIGCTSSIGNMGPT